MTSKWLFNLPPRCSSFALAALAMVALGCSGPATDDTAELVPASGTVMVDGDVVANAAVTFHPTGTTGDPAVGVTNELGMFTLTNSRGREGAEPGNYKVTISKFALADGSPFPPDADSGDFAALGVEHIPPKYSDPGQTELTAEVPPGGKSDLYFELSTE